MKKFFKLGFCLLLLLTIFLVFTAGCGTPAIDQQINGENGAENVNGEEEEAE
ncbi:MAG: hypothetical protein ACYCXI_06210 [Dethiobacteraceae bacterium]|jgi:hypothetical protein